MADWRRERNQQAPLRVLRTTKEVGLWRVYLFELPCRAHAAKLGEAWTFFAQSLVGDQDHRSGWMDEEKSARIVTFLQKNGAYETLYPQAL